MSFLIFVFRVSFLTLLWPPSESAIVGKNSLPLSVFASGVGGWVGMIPGVLLRVTRASTLVVSHMLARVVGVDKVCVLFCCFVSKCFVVLSNIFVNLSKAWPCRPVFIVGSFNIFLDGGCEWSCDLQSPVHWGFPRYLDKGGVQLVLGRYYVATSWWDLKMHAEVMVICWANVTAVQWSWSIGFSCLWWIENGSSCARWSKWHSVEFMMSFEYMECWQLWLHSWVSYHV